MLKQIEHSGEASIANADIYNATKWGVITQEELDSAIEKFKDNQLLENYTQTVPPHARGAVDEIDDFLKGTSQDIQR